MFYRAIDNDLELGSHYQEWDFHSQYSRLPFNDADKHPVIAAVNVVAGELLDILGPVLWAALIVLCLVAAFTPD